MLPSEMSPVTVSQPLGMLMATSPPSVVSRPQVVLEPAAQESAPVSVTGWPLTANPELANVTSLMLRPLMSLTAASPVAPLKTRLSPDCGAVFVLQLAGVLHMPSRPRPVHVCVSGSGSAAPDMRRTRSLSSTYALPSRRNSRPEGAVKVATLPRPSV